MLRRKDKTWDLISCKNFRVNTKNFENESQGMRSAPLFRFRYLLQYELTRQLHLFLHRHTFQLIEIFLHSVPTTRSSFIPVLKARQVHFPQCLPKPQWRHKPKMLRRTPTLSRAHPRPSFSLRRPTSFRRLQTRIRFSVPNVRRSSPNSKNQVCCPRYLVDTIGPLALEIDLVGPLWPPFRRASVMADPCPPACPPSLPYLTIS